MNSLHSRYNSKSIIQSRWWCWQAFDGGKHLVHSGMSASALYLFERLYSLAKVCTRSALNTLCSPPCTLYSSIYAHHSVLTSLHSVLTTLHAPLCTHHSALTTLHLPLHTCHCAHRNPGNHATHKAAFPHRAVQQRCGCQHGSDWLHQICTTTHTCRPCHMQSEKASKEVAMSSQILIKFITCMQHCNMCASGSMLAGAHIGSDTEHDT